MRKKELEKILSSLEVFIHPKVRLEQYSTSPAIAADLLWNAYTEGFLQGKLVADLGCGNGILGLGALILGAKRVSFVDADPEALVLAQANKKIVEKTLGRKFSCSFLRLSVRDFHEQVEVVFQNPPFGVQLVHSDRVFLEMAMKVAPVIYSFHKLSTRHFVEHFAEEHGFSVRALYRYDLPLRSQFWFHRSLVRKVAVGCWMLTKKTL